MVVDCGGGIIETEENIKIIKNTGIVIWLQASVNTIKKRLEKDSKNIRPSLTGISITEEIEDVLLKRLPLYKKAADYVIDTENKTIKEIADEICALLKSKTKICVSITATSLDSALSDIKEAEKLVDIIEIRIDYIAGRSLLVLVDISSGKP